MGTSHLANGHETSYCCYAFLDVELVINLGYLKHVQVKGIGSIPRVQMGRVAGVTPTMYSDPNPVMKGQREVLYALQSLLY